LRFGNVKPISQIKRDRASSAAEWYRLLVESQANLEEIKKAKLAELNEACGKAITGRFTAEVRGQTYEFSYDYEAQSNFKDAKIAFLEGQTTTVRWTAYLNDQIVRIDLDQEEFNQVYYASLAHKNVHIARFRDQLQPLVEAATTVEEVDAINW